MTVSSSRKCWVRTLPRRPFIHCFRLVPSKCPEQALVLRLPRIVQLAHVLSLLSFEECSQFSECTKPIRCEKGIQTTICGCRSSPLPNRLKATKLLKSKTVITELATRKNTEGKTSFRSFCGTIVLLPEMDMAWIRDAIGISVSILPLVLAICIALPLLWFRRSPREQENKQEDEEGDIAWILKALNSFQASFNSLAPARTPLPRNDVKKLNDYIYELCKPSGRPSVELVFFHGFQLGGSTETFVTTWLAGNKSELWLNWIIGPFPDARILLVSYDAFATKKSDKVCIDMYITCENLVQSLTDDAAGVGQDGCPVILVGHSLGGLVIKEILLQANKVLSLGKHPNERVQYFFENVKQLFYYSCPHNGTRLADIKTKLRKGPLFKLLTTLNKKAARCNEDFRQLRVKFNWGAYSIAEQLPADLGSHGHLVVVEEASARHDTDDYYTAHADHFSVCQPTSMSDTSFCKLRDVIDRTVKKDVRGHQITIPTEFVGLIDQINRVQRKLKTARHVGICGIGGIGKSTLAKVVYNAISGHFEYTSFVSEVKKSVGKRASMKDLQDEILRNLYHKGHECELRWERLERKRVLIILDDVECESQIFVMPDTDRGVSFFSDESRVLVTSRNRRIVSSKDFEVYNAEFLGDEASRKLFCHHAFKKEHAPSIYEDRVEKFTSKCGGLPLALEVAGKYLYKQAEDMWDDAFTRFSAAKPFDGGREDDFWSIFEIIYKSLQQEEREMFLDVATCFHNVKLEQVKRIWGCCDWVTTPNVGWQNLVDIGFVRQDNRDNNRYFLRTHEVLREPYIWMHEVLRDFGYSKANPGSLQSHSRICYRESGDLPTWPFKQGTPPVKILKIQLLSGRKLHEGELATKPIIDIEKLLRGKELREGELATKPVIDIEKLLWGTELREGELGTKPVIDIETLSALKNLKVLWLEGVSLHGAWNLLPDNLEFLRMRACTWSDKSSASSEDCYVPGGKVHLRRSSGWCSTLCGESSSLKSGPHPSLQHMELGPYNSSGMENETFKQLRALKYLLITSKRKWKFLPDSLWKLPALETLELHDLKHLESVPGSDVQLPALKRLTITHCESLKNIEETFGQLSALEDLALEDLAVRALPSTLGELRALRQLKIVWCEYLEDIPDNLGQLQNLRRLHISNCRDLKSLPNTLGQLHSLLHLHISSSWKPKALPKVGYFLDASFSLAALPDTLGQLQNLRQFILDRCDSLEALPESIGHIFSLENLQIRGCERLKTLPNTIGQLRGLRRLCIDESGLETLPDTLGDLEALEHLQIVRCWDLRALPDTLGKLPALRQFRIEDCDKLKALPHGPWKCPTLERLVVKGCRSLKLLPARITELQALPHFEIDKQSTLHDSDKEGETDGEDPGWPELVPCECAVCQAYERPWLRERGREHRGWPRLVLCWCIACQAYERFGRGEVARERQRGIWRTVCWPKCGDVSWLPIDDCARLRSLRVR